MRVCATPLLAALALGACTIAPDRIASVDPVPQSWPAGDSYLAQAEAGLPAVSYRDIFIDPRLRTLIEQALVDNRDLAVAAANIAAARAQVRVVRSAQFPEIGVDGSVTRRQSGSTSSGTGESTSSGSRTQFSLQGGISAFELDLFGRLVNATAAERQRALSTEAAARTVRLALVADLAGAWASYAADRDLLAIARDTATSARRSVQLTRARLQGGVAPRTDLRQAEQVLDTAEGDLALRTTALAQDENLIRLLIGGTVDPSLLPDNLDEAIRAVATLPAGTSSEVLLRRPDVVEAEYLLRAASADIAVARAELFPRISLNGLLGLASTALSSLVSSDGFAATGGVGAGYTIFDAGGRRANVAVTRAQRDAALGRYEKAIQTAFREVADALATQGRIAERVRAAVANTAASADVARLTEARYRGGVDSFLASLDAQRSLFQARQQETAVRLALVQNRIDLYRALGGDQATSVKADPQAPARRGLF
ncbi:MAG: efflux transporter outer membrane subunit [Novosphingobium sp.]